MKNQFIAIFLIALICSSNSVNLRRNSISSPMENLSEMGKMSEFASNLFVTINLSLQSGGKVDEVIDFVKSAHTEAQESRNTLQANYKAEKARLDEQISGLETEINTLQGSLTIVLENIEEYNKEITNLNNQRTRLENEWTGIKERQGALEIARDNDIEAFRARQRRDSNTISALEDIIPALENLQQNGSAFLEKSHHEILLALNRIPENKPLQMFVELSTQFDKQKLGEVIIKLGKILESVSTNKIQDETDEQVSKNRYQALSFELEQLYQAKQKQVQEVKIQLSAKEQGLRHNVTFRDELTQNLTETNGLKSATETILTTTTNTFNTNFEAANQAVDALKAALDILTESEATLETQENQAQNDLN